MLEKVGFLVLVFLFFDFMSFLEIHCEHPNIYQGVCSDCYHQFTIDDFLEILFQVTL